MPWPGGGNEGRPASTLAERAVVTSTDYGADPTGVADSTAAFQAMLDDGDLLIDTGTYRVGYVTYEGAEDRSIRTVPGAHVTIIQTNILGVFRLRGGWDALGAISSIAPGNVDGNDDGTTQTYVSLLQMSGATSVTKGDVVKVVSDNRPLGEDPTVTSGTVSRRGEHSMVALSSSGTTVSLGNQLIDTYTTSPRLARLWNTTFVVEGDITFEGDPAIAATAGFGASIELRAAKYCVVDGVSFTGIPGSGIINHTFAASIRNCRFKALSNRPSLSHFGYGVMDGGHETRITNCHGENLRHLVSENCGVIAAASTNFEYYGGGMYGQVSGCTASSCQAAAFDTHHTAYGYTFTGCKAFGAFIGASSGGNGFTMRGRKITLRGCEAHACWVGFNVVTYDSAYLDDCEAIDSTYEALMIDTATVSDPAIVASTNVRLNGGVYEASRNTLTRVVHVGNTTGGYPPTVVAQGTTFRAIGSAGAGSCFFDIYSTSTVKLYGCTLDMDPWTGGAATVIGFQIRDTGATLTVRDLRIFYKGAATDSVMTLATGSSGSNASRVRIHDYDYEYTGPNTRALTTTHGNLTDMKTSGLQRYGTSWFQKNRSASTTIVASASVSLTPLGVLLDDHVFCRFTGSAGALTIGSLPTPDFQGQRLTLVNKSNGVLTVPSITPTIAVDESMTLVYGLGAAAWVVVSEGDAYTDDAVADHAAIEAGAHGITDPADLVYQGDAILLDPDALEGSCSTMPRRSATATTVSAPSGQARLGYFTPQEDLLITQLELWLGGTAAAATPSLVRAALFLIAANGDGTLVAAAANFTTWLSGTINTPVPRALSSGGGLPTSYTCLAGQRYALMELVVTGAATPTLRGHTGNSAADYGRPPRLGGVTVATNLTDIPSGSPSFVAADITDSASIPYITALA